jgi:hypothetical protein
VPKQIVKNSELETSIEKPERGKGKVLPQAEEGQKLLGLRKRWYKFYDRMCSNWA